MLYTIVHGQSLLLYNERPDVNCAVDVNDTLQIRNTRVLSNQIIFIGRQMPTHNVV